MAIDAEHSRFQVVVDAFKELCLETTVDFKGGEFYEGEEALISLRYEKLFGYCKICNSLCHKDDICPLDKKNSTKSPERKRETREGNGGGYDGGKHEDRARSYKGVVINGNGGNQTKERDSRDYYGKGKGKMFEEPDSKWVRVPERSNKKNSNYRGNYRGDGGASRSRGLVEKDQDQGNRKDATGSILVRKSSTMIVVAHGRRIEKRGRSSP